MTKSSAFTPAILFAVASALTLTACGEPEEKSYEADVTDESGGKLIVSEPDPDAVPVDLPETKMTAVPAENETAEMPVETPAD